MDKQEFLAQLRRGLSGLPKDDIEERLSFYHEMIDDRMDEGLPEDMAVSQIGSVEDIISQIDSGRATKEKRKRKPWETVLLVLGSPIWISLVIAAFAVALSVNVSLWAVILSLWAVFASLVACSLAGAAAGIVLICQGYMLSGIAMIAAGLIGAGLSVFVFFGCRAAGKGILLLTKKTVLWLGKREANQ